MTQNEFSKSLVQLGDLLEKLAKQVVVQANAIDKLNEKINKIENPKIESLFNMKRENPFKEGTN
tara:strand:- start:134 stop:325 length:192 start_codon:yes stop_codon:yes gene_type:complete